MILHDIDPASVKQRIDEGNPVIVKLGAGWCSPCNDLSIELEKIGKEIDGTVTIIMIDIDKIGKSMNRLSKIVPGMNVLSKVGAVPILVFFNDGKRIENTVENGCQIPGIAIGYKKKKALKKIIEKYLLA
jgi:thiol-disulfide isomerase/thioredoxin